MDALLRKLSTRLAFQGGHDRSGACGSELLSAAGCLLAEGLGDASSSSSKGKVDDDIAYELVEAMKCGQVMCGFADYWSSASKSNANEGVASVLATMVVELDQRGDRGSVPRLFGAWLDCRGRGNVVDLLSLMTPSGHLVALPELESRGELQAAWESCLVKDRRLTGSVLARAGAIIRRRAGRGAREGGFGAFLASLSGLATSAPGEVLEAVADLCIEALGADDALRSKVTPFALQFMCSALLDRGGGEVKVDAVPFGSFVDVLKRCPRAEGEDKSLLRTLPPFS